MASLRMHPCHTWRYFRLWPISLTKFAKLITCKANCQWLCKIISFWIALFSASKAACRKRPMVLHTLSGCRPSLTLQTAPYACTLPTICRRLAFAFCKSLRQVSQMPLASCFWCFVSLRISCAHAYMAFLIIISGPDLILPYNLKDSGTAQALAMLLKFTILLACR